VFFWYFSCPTRKVRIPFSYNKKKVDKHKKTLRKKKAEESVDSSAKKTQL
jgi:hypothetical protein